MPAISLGFEQVEVRLGLIRRRLNLFALQNTVYLGGSLAALSATLLILLAVRGRPEAFKLALWISTLGGVVACSWAVYALHRSWLSVENVARLADQKGKLDDRLSTLLAHRGNGPTRLWSLLLTQALALSSRWDARAVAPRRIPRSLFYLLGSLAILVATAFFVSAPTPEGQAIGSATPSTAAADLHHPPSAEREPSSAAASGEPGANGSGATAENGDGDTMPAALAATSGQSAAGGHAGARRVARAGASAGRNPGLEDTDGEAGGPMPRRMQNLIRRLFGVAPVANHSRPAGAKAPSALQGKRWGGKSTEKTAGDGQPRAGEAQAEPKRNPDGSPANTKSARALVEARGGSKAGGQGGSKSGELFAQQQGKGPSAATRSFTLKLTTFSSSAAASLEPQRNRRRNTVPDTGPVAGGSVNESPMGEQTTPDDPLQQTEVSAEHEAILRRIFTRN